MPPVRVDPDKVCRFEDAESFYAWLGKHHDTEDELWIRIFKLKSGVKSITSKEAVDVVLCWGWIDGVCKGLDEKSFLQRYTPRRPRSIWSQVNVENVARLIDEGRMTVHGLKQVESAKKDGRWERAYRTRGSTIPADLQAAIDAEPEAKAMLAKLNAQNRFALAFQLNNLKTEAGRMKKIATFVEMLKRGETLYPQRRR
jgi:uncharacterized protein YdeI (YjbR/CyaY-like superfamily)